MSEIEARTMAIITRLLREQTRVALSSEESTVLALWAFKTAIVLNASSNYRRIVPDSHFTHLFDSRRIPPLVFVDVGRIQDHLSLASRQSQHFVGMVNGKATDAIEAMRHSCYNIVLGVASLAVRVTHLPLEGYQVVQDLEQPDRTRRLWPLTSELVTLDAGTAFQDLEEFEMSVAFAPDPA